MLLTKIKTNIGYRLSQGKKLPEDEVLESLINEAMYYVCYRCVPAELLRTFVDYEYKPLRFLQNGRFIVVPEYPDFTKTSRHLQIDENLTFAVINYTAFLISSNPTHKQLADEIINEHIAVEGVENYGTYAE